MVLLDLADISIARCEQRLGTSSARVRLFWGAGWGEVGEQGCVPDTAALMGTPVSTLPTRYILACSLKRKENVHFILPYRGRVLLRHLAFLKYFDEVCNLLFLKCSSYAAISH